MFQKSDIEEILESQTWKRSSKGLIKREKIVKKPSVGKGAVAINEKRTLDIPALLAPIPQIKSPNRASFLAINLNAMSSTISKVLKNEDFNCLKIPTFPKSPFGVHSDSSKRFPTFQVVPKPSDLNIENINAIKLESGRIKRCIKSTSSSAIGFLKKSKKFHSRNSSYNINTPQHQHPNKPPSTTFPISTKN